MLVTEIGQHNNGTMKTTAHMISYDGQWTRMKQKQAAAFLSPHLGPKMNILQRHVFPIVESLRLESVKLQLAVLYIGTTDHFFINSNME